MHESATSTVTTPRLTVRVASERGRADFGWLDSRHSFSFGRYWDPEHMGFRALRVINDDRVRPGQGFGTHHHDNMEIVSVVVSGALEHRDSLGNGSIMRPGEVQCMTAGTGILHSEFNPSPDEPVHFLQIWIEPERRGLPPSYDQRRFPEVEDRLVTVVSPDGRDGSLAVHQDVTIRRGRISSVGEVVYDLAPGRHAWLQVIEGEVEVEGVLLATGDGASTSESGLLRIRGRRAADVLLFDLA